jgi:surface antigen
VQCQPAGVEKGGCTMKRTNQPGGVGTGTRLAQSFRLIASAVARMAIACGLALSTVALLPPRVAQAASPGCVSGKDLMPGAILYSPPLGGQSEYKLVMQGNGNLVTYELGSDSKWHPLWDTQTAGNQNQYYAAIQASDGNLVIYASPNHVHPVWAAFAFQPYSPRPRSPNAQLCMQTDGNLVIYSASGTAVWATMNNVVAAWGGTDSSNPFPPGQCTWYADKMFHLWNIYGSYVGWGGDARYWAHNAAAVGWRVGTTPRVGSIAVFQPGVDGAGSAGHVAWVRQFYPNLNSVLVSEMNFPRLGVEDYRLISPGSRSGLQYIYVNAAKIP